MNELQVIEHEIKRSERNYQICKRRKIDIAGKNWLWWWLESAQLREELKKIS